MHKPFVSLNTQTVKQLADSSKVFSRGEEYFHSGAVAKVWIEGNKLFARVLGSNGKYRVTVEDNDDKFLCHCTCPYEGENCKHIVAACLAFLDRKDELLASAKRKEGEHDDLRTQMHTLDKEDLADLLVLSLKTHKDWKNTLLHELANRFKGKGAGTVNQKIYEEQFSNHFDRVREVLQEFNEYGGGPEEEEEEAYGGLQEIVKLFKEKKLNTETKRQFIDKMFHYYDWDNSGLNDMVMEAVFESATERADWEYIIEKLKTKKEDSSYRQSLIIDIYRNHLKDDAEYLKLRQQDLQYGNDYFDLVQYWHKKGEIDKAVAVAKEGVESCERGVDDLLEHLFNHYTGKDYAAALGYLKKIFVEHQNLEQYKRLQKFARKEDWKELDRWCGDLLEKEKVFHELARIHRFNKEYDKVLAYVLANVNDNWIWDDGEREQFADEMIERYPNELVPFYQKRAERHIARMGRKDYQKAAHYAKKLKGIYCKRLNQKEVWQKFIDNIRERYANRRALLEELKNL